MTHSADVITIFPIDFIASIAVQSTSITIAAIKLLDI